MQDNFVVVKIGKSQHIVSVDDVITIDRIAGKIGDTVSYSDVLLQKEGSKVTVGKPVLPISVSAEIVGQTKGKKMDVITFKAKARQRRKLGHRQLYTKIRIKRIASSKGAPSKAASKEVVKAKTPVARPVVKRVVKRTVVKAKARAKPAAKKTSK